MQEFAINFLALAAVVLSFSIHRRAISRTAASKNCATSVTPGLRASRAGERPIPLRKLCANDNYDLIGVSLSDHYGFS